MTAALVEHAQQPSRNFGIDAVRVGTTFLVVFHHTAITYGAVGAWYYKEVQTDGSLSSMLLVFRLSRFGRARWRGGVVNWARTPQ